MKMQIAADVGEGDEMRQPALSCRFDFAVVFTQFELDKRQAEIPVGILFGPSGDAACAVEEPVFVELEAADGRVGPRDRICATSS
jgi:hypothetical protein